ncbi:MAG: PEP-CTERM sorting domain-containing protein [Sedimentisphaerales bacterium]|nr:PEP-CTERM sorting domain-containing protein [Sedimentisphaerales bacterium]
MKRRTIQLVALVIGLLPAATVVHAAEAEQAEVTAYELCIEHSPIKAGTVTPKVGMHRFSANSVVTLSADPQPGYQFAYWIGDVSDPKSKQTTVRVDAAKIVVAVFRSAQDDGMERKLSLGGGGGGPTRLVPSLVDLQGPGFSISGGGGTTKTVAVPIVVPSVPTPEPTTILLLGLGALALRRKRQ